MKRTLITGTFLFLGSFTLVRAQMNVGSASAPDPSAILQLSSSNQGLRLPNVSLTSTTTFGLAGSASAATVGMQVYNTNASITSTNLSYPISTGGIGSYTWDGTGWKLAATNTPAMEVHAKFTGLTRGTAGTSTVFTSANTATITTGSNMNTIPGADYVPSTGIITLPAGTYLFTISCYLAAGSGTGVQPAIHGFYYKFPTDVGATNGTTTDLVAAVAGNNSATNNSIGFTLSYTPTLTSSRTCQFGIFWSDGSLNLPASLTYSGNFSFSITKLQ